jgi:hypothetical protein
MNRSRLFVTALTVMSSLSAATSVDAQNVRGFVFGQESSAPLEGVLIRLMSRNLEPLDTVTTDMLGRFAFQARGPERYVVVAELEGYAAAPQVVEVGPIALAKVEVTIAMQSMGTTSESPIVGDQRIAHLRGRVVVSGTNDPVEGATVTLLGTETRVLTRWDGRFVIGDVQPGLQRIEVEHLAYGSRNWAIEARPGSAYDALIPVEEEAIALDGIEVTVRSRAVARKLEPVFERMERALGGIFMTKADFVQRGNPPVAQMLQGLPSTRVTGSGASSWTLRFRRGSNSLQQGCAPEIWIDGIRMVRAGDPVAEFLAMTTLDVEIIEVFPSASSIPADYTTSAFCMVGIWTRRGG